MLLACYRNGERSMTDQEPVDTDGFISSFKGFMDQVAVL
jgi:hypothetical protein